MTESYTAADIKILSSEEALENAPWLASETLAAKYNLDIDFIRRGLEACRLAGVHPDYFILRYLEEDKAIPIDLAVDYQSRVLQGLIKLPTNNFSQHY